MPEAESTALIPAGDAPPAPLVVEDTHGMPFFPNETELKVILTLAATAVKAGEGFVPKNVTNAHQAAGIMLAGRELGVRPFTALRHIYPVNGKFELEARLMAGVCKSKDPSIDFIPTCYTRERVAIVLHRGGKTYAELDYTIEDATKSGQYRPNDEKAKYGPWVKYTRDMLWAACLKRVCRIYCPDLINSIDAGLDNAVSFIEGGPATAVRVIAPEEPHTDDGQKAAAAVLQSPMGRNEGDEGGLPPEVEDALEQHEPEPAGDVDALAVEVLGFVNEARETMGSPDFSAWATRIRADFPMAFDQAGKAQFKTMHPDDLTKLRDRMKVDVRGAGPDAES